MSVEIRPATRTTIKPLIVLYAESGCGKTFSALLLARGFVGPTGRVVLVDSESGRGSLYADVMPGGYDVLQLEPPFTPARYVEAMEAVEAAGAAIGILDSGSHEWESGVLDMATENEHRSGKPGLHNWREPKIEHAKFVRHLLRAKIPWIVALRAKFKTRQTKDERGKTVIVKDDNVSPLQAEDFIFEATFHAEILPDHSLRITKTGHPELVKCFPPAGKPITSEHGQQLATWCASPQGPGTRKAPAGDERKDLDRRLWELLADIHKMKPGERDKQTVNAARVLRNKWLIDNAILSDTETAETIPTDRLKAVVEATDEHLKELAAQTHNV